MLHNILTGVDDGTMLKIAGALIPTIIFLWIIITVTALHKRDVYFWSLGSTWTTIIGCPVDLIIAWISLGVTHDPNAVPFSTPFIAAYPSATI